MARRGRPTRIAVFDRLNTAVAELHANVGGLPTPVEGEEIWEGIWYEETHNSTALEGNTLILKEVKTLLDDGRAVGDKEFREYLEVQGYADAAKWVYHRAFEASMYEDPTTPRLITLKEVSEIHRLVVEPAWRHFPPSEYDDQEGPGAYRRHDINPFPTGMTPPNWPDVPAQMTDWVDKANEMVAYFSSWLQQELDDTIPANHPIARLADLHAHFERVHPFRDGNGRTGRLVLNLMLVRMYFPPAVIYKRDRTKYLKALDRADHGDPCPLGELLARALIHSIDRFLLPNLAGPQRLIRLSALADNELSPIALRRAAERGRLRAQRRSDQWYSCKKWVDEYKQSRRRGKSPEPVGIPAVAQPVRSADDPNERGRLF